MSFKKYLKEVIDTEDRYIGPDVNPTNDEREYSIRKVVDDRIQEFEAKLLELADYYGTGVTTPTGQPKPKYKDEL